ncbi:hypothetical protein RB653_009260 [Dictyostelium firmibasis]|uniref:PH domain-containing protein n=1 Tax=Dictyostelium firmibasis TaxID=79012 RepID=A0AAN7YUX5_9MYCE
MDERHTLNVQIIENGVVGNWEKRFIIIEGSEIRVKNDRESIMISFSLKLQHIEVLPNFDDECGITVGSEIDGGDVEMSTTSKKLLKLKPLFSPSPIVYVFELKSQSEYDRWVLFIQSSRVQQQTKEEELEYKSSSSSYNEPTTTKTTTGAFYSQKSYSHHEKGWRHTFKKIAQKTGLVLVFLIYTALLAALFGAMWVYYVGPILTIDEMKTTCYVNSSDWGYISKGYYSVDFNVTYKIESGDILNNIMVQYCKGVLCNVGLDAEYPVGSNSTCYYDNKDPDFVYYDIYPMADYRLTITFGLCGSLFGIWIIFLIIL